MVHLPKPGLRVNIFAQSMEGRGFLHEMQWNVECQYALLFAGSDIVTFRTEPELTVTVLSKDVTAPFTLEDLHIF